MGPWIDPRLPCWPCLMSAPRLTRSIMTSFYNAFLSLSVLLANLLTGSAHSYAIAPRVVFGSTRSQWAPAPFGLPQGSVLGPLLYILYTSEIGLLLSSCGVLNQIYADDTQAYVHCPAGKATTAAHSMQLAIDSLGGWMSSNRLRLNPSKTQFIWLSTRQQLAKLDLCALSTQFPFSLSALRFGILE
jgi:hypothetical protein